MKGLCREPALALTADAGFRAWQFNLELFRLWPYPNPYLAVM